MICHLEPKLPTCKQCKKSLCVNEAHSSEKFSTQFSSSRKEWLVKKGRTYEVSQGSWAFLLTQMNFSIVTFLQLNKGNVWPLLGNKVNFVFAGTTPMDVVIKASPTAKLN